MAKEARIRELGFRHTQLECEIENARKSPSIDSLQIAGLKKQKLRIKEELTALRQGA